MSAIRCAGAVIGLVVFRGGFLAATGQPTINRVLTAPQPPPGMAGPPVDRARAQFEAGRYREAIGTLTAALMSDPHDAAVAFWLGRSYLELHEYDQAIERMRRAVELDPQGSECHRWLGRAYGEKADSDRGLFGLSAFSLGRKAGAEFRLAVQLDARNLMARRDLLLFYLEAPAALGGGKDKAWHEVQAIAAIDAVTGHLARAEYFRHEQRFDQADAEYQAALKLNPTQVDPYLDAADFYEARGNEPHLRDVVEAAARVNALDPRLNYYLGVTDVLRRRLPEATRHLERYLADAPQRSDWPSHASARVWLGQAYERGGNGAEAAAQYRAALKLDPDRKAAKEALRRLGER